MQRRLPYTDDVKTQWESQLIEQVIAYIKQLDKIVQPTQTLYIAVDGVAPMAKIKQQRMRRFKSAIAAEEEARIRAHAKGVPYVAQPRWDSNAITPGTRFMANLATALRAYGKTVGENGRKVVVSPADEPGEGEQKIMDYVRASKPHDVVVYGLDADLIVLSLAASTLGVQMDLFREEVEFNGGGVKEDAHGVEQFLYMHINVLAQTLYARYGKPGATLESFVADFVALMSFLGNDFVAHGMSLKIKENGIDRLLRIYNEQLTTPLLLAANGTYNPVTLQALFQILAAEEPRHILQSVKKKLTARVGSTPSKDPEEQALARYNDGPVLRAEETPLITYVAVEGYEKPQMILRDHWEATYDTLALWGANPADAVRAYLESLAWTLAYYTGIPVDMDWYYPWALPPRMATVAATLETQGMPAAPATRRTPLKPIEQLAMVLPQSSFHLLPKEYADLNVRYPHAWPVKWNTYSFGRRFTWECEPLIPLVQPAQMKQWLEEMVEE